MELDHSRKSFFSLSFEDLRSLLKENSLNESGAALIYNWIYKKILISPNIPNLSNSTKEFISKYLDLTLPKITLTQKTTTEDILKTTTKFLMTFADGKSVESVLIPFQGKYTLCLSSQVGCAMKCSFCYTGTQGLDRHLSAEEIVGQLVSALLWLKENDVEERISNLVFMGQGEPLHNMNSVRKACEIFLSQHGLSLGREKITISTAGYLPGLKEWRDNPIPVNLALSFHCPDDLIRSQLIPLNKSYPLKEILKTIKSIPLERKRFITFEILLIDELNDGLSFAHETAELIKEMSPLVNIIPFNPFPGTPYKRPTDEKIDQFKEVIESYGIATMVRRTKGDAILAACGQLRSV
ncbi:MAG: 23S rRNA (adenine(2503)-C(2))-methyltransferase RlmN [Bacteriovoracaceae bacterium]|nr:23S rRNA (adenine(2503)-C(2))-methyltransferase RlmN [Bacteriovoracaceae bacterium]